MVDENEFSMRNTNLQHDEGESAHKVTPLHTSINCTQGAIRADSVRGRRVAPKLCQVSKDVQGSSQIIAHQIEVPVRGLGGQWECTVEVHSGSATSNQRPPRSRPRVATQCYPCRPQEVVHGNG